MATTDLDHTKENLRTLYLKKRKALHENEWEALNTSLSTQSKKLDLSGVGTAHIFLPIRKHAEPDTHRIVAALRTIAPPIRWVISRSDLDRGELYHFVWDNQTVIQENRWGIPEPLGGYRVQEEEIDLVFVPLLIFDTFGHRVGYGKGYYDRFLAKCRPDTLKVGLSLFEPIPLIQGLFDSDVALDACITPDTIYRFNDRR